MASNGVEKVGVLIVGAGPTGLGAATRLNQLGHPNWLLVDKEPEAGGLACTDVTKEGFLFDMGGHIMFSHYQYFDDLLDAAIGAGEKSWTTLQRVCYIWMKNRWVAYPMQNNISALDKEDQIKCLTGLVEAKVQNAVALGKPHSFDEWIMRTMGKGLADLFLRPYNYQVWAHPTHMLQCDWLGERVAVVDVERAISNVIMNKEDAGWGPNAVFRFPKEGGTGGAWKGVSKLLPPERQSYNTTLVSIDKDKQIAKFADGRQIAYDALISTIPLDIMGSWLGKPEWGKGLLHSSTHIIGFGIRGISPHDMKCWMYFPESNCPFYRTTVFSHYAEKNCPAGDVKLPTLCMADCTDPKPGKDAASEGPYWSLMFEVSESQYKQIAQDPVKLGGTAGTWPEVVRDTLLGAITTGLMKADDEVVSIFHRRFEYGYPTPSLSRDGVLKEALPWLRQHNIWSRGRFGSWKYEVANQDHSLMLGVECVDAILFGTQELTLECPNVVNPRKNMELKYTQDPIIPGLLMNAKPVAVLEK